MNNPYAEYLFIAQAPGSTEVYAIPNRWKQTYLKWCECELFDDTWKQYMDYFSPYEITMTHEEFVKWQQK